MSLSVSRMSFIEFFVGHEHQQRIFTFLLPGQPTRHSDDCFWSLSGLCSLLPSFPTCPFSACTHADKCSDIFQRHRNDDDEDGGVIDGVPESRPLQNQPESCEGECTARSHEGRPGARVKLG